MSENALKYLSMQVFHKIRCCALVGALELMKFRPIDPGQHKKLFLVTIRPHKPIRSGTLAHRIKNVLCNSGIDQSIFNAHSRRAASSTAARVRLSVSVIIKMSDWLSDSTFRHFYYKPIHDSLFGRIVLSLS